MTKVYDYTQGSKFRQIQFGLSQWPLSLFFSRQRWQLYATAYSQRRNGSPTPLTTHDSPQDFLWRKKELQVEK